MSSKALVIVEGEDRESQLFEQIQQAFSWKMEIVPFSGNISMLYDEMAKSNFMMDVVSLLRARTSDPEELAILSNTYSDVFLVFDLDPQHSLKVEDTESPEDALRRNSSRIVGKAMAMARKLNDSTDPTLGQLYINYPSIESFRDADDFFDNGFSDKQVHVRDLCKSSPFGGQGYKAISSKGKLVNKKRITTYTADDFSLLAMMNACKLRRINDGVWDCFSYDDFRKYSRQEDILSVQAEKILKTLSLWVLNTSLFLAIDYKGKSFYESLCKRISHLLHGDNTLRVDENVERLLSCE